MTDTESELRIKQWAREERAANRRDRAVAIAMNKANAKQDAKPFGIPKQRRRGAG